MANTLPLNTLTISDPYLRALARLHVATDHIAARAGNDDGLRGKILEALKQRAKTYAALEAADVEFVPANGGGVGVRLKAPRA
jgi:hypothetical protein